MRKQHSAASIEAREWDELGRAFANSSFLLYIERLQALNNAPQKANELFNKGHEFADESMSIVMYQQRLPFRVKRIGPAGPKNSPDRIIAIVRWSRERQPRLPLVPNHRQRRSGNRP